jgi:hypothetical protein
MMDDLIMIGLGMAIGFAIAKFLESRGIGRGGGGD